MAVRWLFTCVALVLVITGGDCFQWTGSLQDSTLVAVCLHGNVSLPWAFTLSSDETIQDIKWNFRSNNGQQELVAMFVGDAFVALPSFSQRVQYLSNGGLVLTHVTRGDAGNFTVEVAVRDAAGTIHDYRRTAVVDVAVGLRVREVSDPVYDPVTDSWHATLSCGTVLNPDNQVQWQTPSGVVPSTRHEGGRFYLQLQNPVVGGNYTCSLTPNATADVCLPLESQQEATIFVDESQVRVSLLEAENQQMRTTLAQLKAEDLDTKARVAQLETAISDLRHIVGLDNTTASLRETVIRQVSFHARMNDTIDDWNYSFSEPVILSVILSNQGDAFNGTTFVAPYNGTYFFAATAGSYSIGYAGFYLMVDDTVFCHAMSSDQSFYDGNSCMVTAHLTEGQSVWLQSFSPSHFMWDLTVFTGFLVSTDD